ncbi:phage tail tape measure protein [Acidipropionibacterium acidipropionici]|nr:phage tail tape measure protein [Acidipropionibacterium acidipropionici]
MASGAGRSMVVKFEARTDALRRQVAGAETILQRFQRTTSRVGAGMKAAVTSAAGMVTGVAGVGSALAAAAKSSMDFEAQVSKVRATGGATEPQLKALEAQAMKMGKTFGVSATDAMQSVEALAKAGVSTQDIMGGGLTGALSLAAAGEMDVGESAETASSAMAQFGLKGKDVGHIADVLAQGANLAQGGVSELSQALSQGGMVASQMGMSLDQTVGVLAEFANKGLMGSDAGTSLKSMLQRLSNPAADAKRQMEKLGIAAYDSSGKFVGLSNFAGQLQTSMSKLTPAQRDAAMSTIFGSDAVRAASILYTDGAKGVAKWTKDVGKSGAAMDTARVNTDNLKGDLDKAKASFQDAFITMGKSSQSPLRTVVQGFSSIADKAPAALASVTGSISAFVASFKAADGDITSSGLNGAIERIGNALGVMWNWGKRNQEWLTPLAVGLGSIAATALSARGIIGAVGAVSRLATSAKLAGDAFGLLSKGMFVKDATKQLAGLSGTSKVIGAMLHPIQAVKGAMTALNVTFLASPWFWVIAGIVALVAAFVVAYKKSETFRNIVNGALNGVKAAALAVGRWFSGPFADFFKKGWEGATGAFDAVKSFFTTTVPNFFIGAWNGIKGAFQTGIDAVVNFVKAYWPILLSVIIGPLGLLIGAVVRHWGQIKAAFSTAIDAIKGVLTGLWTALTNSWAFQAMQSLFLTGFAIIRWVVVNFVNGVKIIWSAFWTGLTTVASAVWGGIKTVVMAGVNAVRAVIVPVINGIRAVWSVVWGAISGFFVGVWNRIYASVALKIAQVHMVIVRVTNIIRAVWGVAWGWVSTRVSTIFNNIHHNISVKILQVQMVITRVMNIIKAVWSVGWNAVKATGTRVMNSVKATFDRILGGIKGAFTNTVSAIGKIWGGIKHTVGAPITFVVDKIINNGIISAIRKVQHFFGLTGKQQMPNLKVPKFRNGGTVDAPFHSAERDDLLGFTPHGVVRLEGGEHITNRESTRRSPRLLEAINSGLLTDRIARFRNGGFVGGRGRLTEIAARRIQAAADSLGWTLQLAQRGWNAPNGLSGTSHAGDAVDVSGPAGGDRLWKIRDALRRQSWAAWVRGPKENFSWHVHAIPLAGAGDARGSAIYQRQAYAAGGDGLHGLSTRDVYATPSGSGGSWLGQAVIAVKSFAERMADKAKSFFKGFSSPVDFLKNKITGMASKITAGIGKSGWASALARIPGKLWESGKTWVTGKFKAFLKKGEEDEGGAAGRSGNMESWRSMVRAALKATGIGSGKADEDSWLRQIMTESSGNPNLIQSSALRDINVRNGDPARGLVQVPGVTWADFGKDQGAFLQNWMKPFKNLVVGMRAAAAQHRNWRAVVGHGHGYEQGTLSAAPGWAWVGERGPELMRLSGGEQILSAAQSSALSRRSSHIAVADTSSGQPALSDAQWDELLDAIHDGQSPVVVDGSTLREAIRSEMRLAARTEKSRTGVLR